MPGVSEAPISSLTFSSKMSFSALLLATSGFDESSSMMIFSGRPFTPPALVDYLFGEQDAIAFGNSPAGCDARERENSPHFDWLTLGRLGCGTRNDAEHQGRSAERCSQHALDRFQNRSPRSSNDVDRGPCHSFQCWQVTTA